MNKNFYFIKVILWLSLAVFVVWLAWKIIVPSGKIVYLLNKDNYSDFISDFEPAERFIKTSEETKIFSDLVYFNLRTTRPFNKLRLTFQYKPYDEPLIEVGLLQDAKIWGYEIKPLYNKTINYFYHSEDWGVLQSDKTILLQRNEKYNSLKQFLAKPPDENLIAVYNYNLPDRDCRKININFLPNSQIDYVIANYQLPKILADGFWESQVEFDLPGRARVSDNYKIILTVPSLKANQLKTGQITIKMIKAEFFGKTWRDFFTL